MPLEVIFARRGDDDIAISELQSGSSTLLDGQAEIEVLDDQTEIEVILADKSDVEVSSIHTERGNLEENGGRSQQQEIEGYFEEKSHLAAKERMQSTTQGGNMAGRDVERSSTGIQGGVATVEDVLSIVHAKIQEIKENERGMQKRETEGVSQKQIDLAATALDTSQDKNLAGGDGIKSSTETEAVGGTSEGSGTVVQLDMVPDIIVANQADNASQMASREAVGPTSEGSGTMVQLDTVPDGKVANQDGKGSPMASLALKNNYGVDHGRRDELVDEKVPEVKGPNDAASRNELADEKVPEVKGPNDAVKGPNDAAPAIPGPSSSVKSLEVVTGGAKEGKNNALIGKEKDQGSGACPLGRIYVYNLPPMFNKDIIDSCRSQCETLQHHSLGEPVTSTSNSTELSHLKALFNDDLSAWFNTHMSSLEPTYHARMLQHPCRTEDPEQASAFYLPFYTGLALERVFSQRNFTLSNHLPKEFVKWLGKQPYFQRSNGSDHFIALGRGMWHFISKGPDEWGCSLLREPEMEHVVVLTNDRNPWVKVVAGIPYTVSFHPSTDDQVRRWQAHLRQWPRRHLVSFVGSTSRGEGFNFSTNRFHFRRRLMEECDNWDACHAFNCKYISDGSIGQCHKAAGPMEVYMNSDFCLQPPGDTWPRKSIFDSMVGGCIPVLFNRDSAYTQYVWYLPLESSSYSVLIDFKDVDAGRVTVKEVLSTYTKEKIAMMRNVVIDSILPKIIVGNPANHKLVEVQDAVSIAVDRVLVRNSRRKAGLKHEIPTPYMLENWSREELRRFMEETHR